MESRETLHLFKDDFLWQNTSAKNQKRNEVFKSRKYFEDRVATYLRGGGSEDDILKLKFNIAAGLQDMFEKRLGSFMNDLKSIVPKRKRSTVIFTGGCSLNCAAMGKLAIDLQKEGFSIVSCSNIPYDAGLCIGAAYMSATKAQNSIKKIRADKSPYLGRRYQSNDYLSVINNNQVEKLISIQSTFVKIV